jgi:hypothetical protein
MENFAWMNMKNSIYDVKIVMDIPLEMFITRNLINETQIYIMEVKFL